jgi:hypothetical protein
MFPEVLIRKLISHGGEGIKEIPLTGGMGVRIKRIQGWRERQANS